MLADDRFSAMFERPEFQVDMESEEYRLINPLMSQMDKVGLFFLHVNSLPQAKLGKGNVCTGEGG